MQLLLFLWHHKTVGVRIITFAGVTHLVTPSGVYTNLGLGIDVDTDSVVSACVEDPDNILVHCYSVDEFIVEPVDTYYWVSLPGPPKEGSYSFTINFTGATVAHRH